MRIPILSKTPDNIGLILYKLFQISSIVNASDDNEIEIDFANTKFLNAIYLAGLFSFIENWKQSGKKVVYININENIEGYLNAVCFNDGLRIEQNELLIRHIGNYSNRRYTPFVVFPIHGFLE